MSRLKHLLWGLLATGTWLAQGGPASAKGDGGNIDVPCEASDVPRAYSVKFPRDAQSPIVVSTNFGLLFSLDQGKTFDFVCTLAMQLETLPNALIPQASTPTVVQLEAGSILATRFPLGLFHSDFGCDWTILQDGYLDTHQISGITLLGPVPETVGPLSTFISTTAGKVPLGVLQSSDGETFTLTDLQDNVLKFTGVAAAGDGATLYAASRQLAPVRINYLYRSDDRGETWEQVASFDADDFYSFAFGAIDPQDPLHLLARGRSVGMCIFDDSLLETFDGGETWQEIAATTQDLLLGSLIQPDGSLWYATLDDGVKRAASGATFEPVSTTGFDGARCLAADGDDVYVCLPAVGDGQELIVRTTDQGKSWETWMTLGAIQGPLACEEVTCSEAWDLFVNTWISPQAGSDGGPTDAGDGEDESSGGCGCSLGQRF